MLTRQQKIQRFIYIVLFVLVFIIITPPIILYSTGYDIGENLSILKTGGIFVQTPESGVSVHLDGKLKETSTILKRGIIIKSLRPDDYEIVVSKTGFVDWKKTINIEDQIVSEVYPYLWPTEPKIVLVKEYLDVATGTKPILNSEYANLSKLFIVSTSSTSLKPTISTSTLSVDYRKVSLLPSAQGIEVSWRGSMENLPYFFCVSRSDCTTEFVIALGKVNLVEFMPGRDDVVFYSTKSGIFVRDLDERTPDNTVLVYKPKNSSFLWELFENSIVIKDGKEIYKLEL